MTSIAIRGDSNWRFMYYYENIAFAYVLAYIIGIEIGRTFKPYFLWEGKLPRDFDGGGRGDPRRGGGDPCASARDNAARRRSNAIAPMVERIGGSASRRNAWSRGRLAARP